MPSTSETEASTVDQSSTDELITLDQPGSESHESPPTTTPSVQASPATADDVSVSKKEIDGTITQLDRGIYKWLTDEDEHETYRALCLSEDPHDLSRQWCIHHRKLPPKSGGISKTYRRRQPRRPRTAQTGGLARENENEEESNAGEGPSERRMSSGEIKQGEDIVESEPLLDDEIAYLRDGLEGVFENYEWK